MQDKCLNTIHFQVILRLSELEKANSNTALLQVTGCLGEKNVNMENYPQVLRKEINPAIKERDKSKQNQIFLCYPVN